MKSLLTKTIISSILFLAFTSIKIQAQTTKAEILTNKNVIEIVKAGLGNEIAISKINSSTCKFDLSTAALIELKKQGVPQEVISSMINKTSTVTKDDRPVAAASAKKSALPVISQLNYVHYLDKGAAVPLEKSLGSSKNKRSLINFKGSSLLLEITGATSPVKLNDAMAETFLINTGGSSVPDIVLYKLKTEKDKRYAIVGKLALGGPKSGDDMMPIEFSKLSDGLYQIKTGSKLTKGEYFFTNKPNLNQSTSSSDVYAFTLL